MLDCSTIPKDPATCVQGDRAEIGQKEWADPLTRNQMNNTSFTLPKLLPQKHSFESSAPLVNTLRSPSSSSLGYGGRQGDSVFFVLKHLQRQVSHCWDLCQHGHRYQHLLLGIYNVLFNHRQVKRKPRVLFSSIRIQNQAAAQNMSKSAMCFSHQQWITIYVRLTWSCCHCLF